MKTIILDNFLNEEELKFTEEYFKKPIWQFGHASVLSYALPQRWFSAYLNDSPFFTEHLKGKIEKICDCNFTIDRVYANGQMILNGGSWHVDSEKPGYFTALLYVSDINPKNVEQIHGHTEFKLNCDEIVSIEPLKNRLIIFDSSIVHRGNAPIVPGFLRISVAWKLKKIT
jgi:hypothetical protein